MKSIFDQNKSIIVLFIVIAATLALWVIPAHSLLGFSPGLSNNWWFELVKENDGSVSGSDFAAIFNTFLMIPIQTLISFLVFLYAYKSFKELKNQTELIKLNLLSSNFNQKLHNMSQRIETDIHHIESKALTALIDYTSLESLELLDRFISTFKNNVGDDAWSKFISLYNINGQLHNLNEEELANIWADYWFNLTVGTLGQRILGSSAAAGLGALMIDVLNQKMPEERQEVYEIIFTYLLGRINHEHFDIRLTIFYIYYSYMSIVGAGGEQLFHLLNFIDKKVKHSFGNTKLGDDYVILARCIFKSRFFSIGMKSVNSLDIRVNGDSATVFLSDNCLAVFKLIAKNEHIYKTDNEMVKVAINNSRYIGEYLYI